MNVGVAYPLAKAGAACPRAKAMAADLRQMMADAQAQAIAAMPPVVAALDERTRLAVVAWVFEALSDHEREGGTFRHLIYDRLGFGGSAYVPLYEAGGMVVSNALNDEGATG